MWPGVCIYRAALPTSGTPSHRPNPTWPAATRKAGIFISNGVRLEWIAGVACFLDLAPLCSRAATTAAAAAA
eukprot:3444034-Pyramimonas_sp.AAC.1